MTPKQVQLVQKTWKLVAPISEQAAELFYGRLFQLDPSVRRLFKSDMKQQGRKLMQSLAIVVNGLTDTEKLVPVLEEMGRRHLDYDVFEQHYDTVGAALLWTLEQGLGDAYTPEVAEAWTAAYSLAADVMKSAAYATAS